MDSKPIHNTTDVSIVGADPWLERALDHPEDIAVDDGYLYAGGEAGQLYRIDRATRTTTVIANTGGFILGVEIGPDGDLYACDFQQHAVFKLPLNDDGSVGTLEPVVKGGPDQKPLHPNYCTFDSNGRLYISDSGTREKLPGPFDDSDGCIYAIDPDGIERVLTDKLSAFPNGLALSQDESALYVCESGNHCISIVHLDDGDATEIEFLTDECGMGDGLALDSEDRLYVSAIGDNTIYRYADGTRETLITDDDGLHINNPTNVAFGGSQMQTLFIANLGLNHITALEIDATGRHPTGRTGVRP